MELYQGLNKIIKKSKKIHSPQGLHEELLKQISMYFSHNNNVARELHFLTLYYGLQGSALTLDAIGKQQESNLTRERIRQIIDSVITPLKTVGDANNASNNPYQKTVDTFDEILADKPFLRLEDLFTHEYFNGFKKNIKGFISFLNDCEIRQVAYRKKYYFYPKRFDRKTVINSIQKENKLLRREKTLEKMALKAKTVTYVPDEVRQHLLDYAEKHNINLNPLYESILNDFMKKTPYMQTDYVFSRTKSWKARKGKAQWQQIGIYIEKDIFDAIKESVKSIRKEMQKNVSLMSFICQAFVWHYESNNS